MARGWSELRPAFVAAGAVNMAAPAAQALIIDAVRAGDMLPLRFVPVRLAHPTLPDVSALVHMSPRALELGRAGDSMRVPVTHRTQQAIADLLGLLMPTPAALDRLVESMPLVAEPITTPEAELPTMGSLASAEKHSRALDASGSAFDNVKSWVSHARLLTPETEAFGRDTAINYGWWTKGAAVPRGVPGPKAAVVSSRFRVLQEPGGRHDVGHTDRSQLALGFMAPDAIVDTGGIELVRSTAGLGIDPLLFPLVSPDGPIPMRHPWIDPCASLVEGGACPPSAGAPESVPARAPRIVRASLRWMPLAVFSAILYYLSRHG